MMRCQANIKSVGWGTSRCNRSAVEGTKYCRRCTGRMVRKQKNAVETALGKPGKNVGWRDPELRQYVHSLPCCLAAHPGHTCAPVFDRRKVECSHVDPKAHAGDHDNIVPACPSLADEMEGRGNRKRAERKYVVSFKEIAQQTTTAFMASKALTV